MSVGNPMSRKHYEAIAKVLRTEHRQAEDEGRRFTVTLIAVHLADVFAEENPRFDRARFLTACGPPGRHLVTADNAVTADGGVHPNT